MDQPGSIKLGDRSPGAYFTAVSEKLAKQNGDIRGLRDMSDLKKNLKENDPRIRSQLRCEGLRRLPGVAEGVDGEEDQERQRVV